MMTIPVHLSINNNFLLGARNIRLSIGPGPRLSLEGVECD